MELVFGLNIKDIRAINHVFSDYASIKCVVMYGSRAKGTFKHGSDIDLTIIDDDLTLTELLEIETKLDDLLLPYKIDLSQKETYPTQI